MGDAFFTSKARAIGHALFWGVNFGVFVATMVYLGTQTPKVRALEEPLAKWGPLICVVVGAILIMFDLSRHVFLDLGLAGEEAAMYNDEGGLSPVGQIGVAGTWVGLVFVASGIACFANLPNKLAKGWETLSQGSQV